MTSAAGHEEATIEAIDEEFYALDHDLRITRINSKAAKRLGTSKEEAIGTYFAKECCEDEELKARVQQALEKGDHQRFEARIGEGWHEVRTRTHPQGIVVLIKDVTRERRARRALKESEEKFAKAFSSNPAAMQIADLRTGQRLAVNDNFCELVGYTEEELLSQSIYDLQTWADPGKQEQALQQLRSTGSVHNQHVEIKNKEGHRRQLLASAALLDIEGTDLALVSYLDVTDHRKAQERLRNIIEHSTNLFYAHTTDNKITYVSPQSEDYLQCSPEEAKTRWTRFLTEHPHNKEALRSTQKAIATGRPQPPYEIEIRGMKGRKRWVEAREAPVIKDGKVISIVGSLSDITQRKKAEEALLASRDSLSRIIDGVPHLIITADKKGIISEWNKSAELKTGLRRQAMVGRRIADLSLPEGIRPLLQQLQSSLQTGRSEIIETEITDTEGNPCILVAGTTLLKDPERRTNGIVLVASDVSSQRRTHQHLRPGRGYLSERPLKELMDIFNQFHSRRGLVLLGRGEEAELRHETLPETTILPLQEGSEADLRGLCEKLKKPSVILITRLEYLSATKGFDGMLRDLYALHDECRKSKHILLLHVEPECFSDRERSILKQEFDRFQAPVHDDVQLSPKLLEVLKHVANRNELHATVNFNELGRQFGISRATTKHWVEELQRLGMVTIHREGKEKQVRLTASGTSLL